MVPVRTIPGTPTGMYQVQYVGCTYTKKNRRKSGDVSDVIKKRGLPSTESCHNSELQHQNMVVRRRSKRKSAVLTKDKRSTRQATALVDEHKIFGDDYGVLPSD
jgi:hypothetical protein